MEGSQNFTKSDKLLAFAAIREVKPYGSNKWEQVARAYARSAGLMGRNARGAEELKRWYSTLCRESMEKPTGVGELRWDLAEAKQSKGK